MTVLSDHPPKSDKSFPDLLRMESRLSAAFDILRHKNTRCPITIAIYGDWGTGKTSAMRWLETQLTTWNGVDEKTRAGHPRVYPIWFDPWRYHTREEVWRGIIAEVILSLFKVHNLDRENVGTRMREAAKMFGAFLGRGFLHALGNLEAGIGDKHTGELKIKGEVFRDIYDEYEKAAQPAKAHLNQFEETLRDWVSRFLKNKEGVFTERLAIFIDDLDRCLPSVTLEVLEAIKLYLNIEPLVFVVGLDRAVVEAVVLKHYKEAGVDERKSRDYLNKLFQIEIQIPPSEAQMEDYLGRQIAALNVSTDGFWNNTLEAAHRDVLEAGFRELARHNPREVKRLLNSALLVGRSAADTPPVEGSATGSARQLRFAQGIQFFLLQRLVRDHVSGASQLFLKTTSLEWFESLSEFAREHPGFCLTDEGLTRVSKHENVLQKIAFGQLAATEVVNPNGLKDSDTAELRELLANRPCYDEGGQQLDPKFFTLPMLWRLLTVPFSAEVAQFAPKVVPTVTGTKPPPMSTVMSTQPEPYQPVSPEHLTPLVRDRIAAQLNKPVQDLTISDLSVIFKLDLSNSDANDTDIAAAAKLTSIKLLDLRSTRISNNAISYVGKLISLLILNLTDTKITDTALISITKINSLRALDLALTRVSDVGVKELTKLQSLDSLNMWGTSLTDAGLKDLGKLTTLRRLDLGGTHMTDVGLIAISNITSLESLSLYGTAVTDDGVKALARLKNIQFLTMWDTKITDKSLIEIAKLSTLQIVDLRGTSVTQDGLSVLKKALPLARIEF